MYEKIECRIFTLLLMSFFTASIFGQSFNTTITDWSDDGSRLLVTSDIKGISEIYEINVDGSSWRQLTNSKLGKINWWGVYSPDESKIAFYSGRDGNAEIYVMDSTGANQKRLTVSEKFDYYPTWSPDGSKIAFYSGRDGNAEIYIMNVDGSNQHNITNNTAADQDPRWSPDGKSIVFQSNRTGKWQIYSYSLKNKKVKNLSKNTFNDELPSWSKDGDKIVFHSNRTGKGQIFLMDNDGKNEQELTGQEKDNFIAVLSPDGDSVIYTSNRNGNLEIYKKPIGVGKEQKISIELLDANSTNESDLWIQDFQFLKAQMTKAYANLKAIVNEQSIDLTRLNSKTISELKLAKSKKEAQLVIHRFLRKFRDGHLGATAIRGLSEDASKDISKDTNNFPLNTDSTTVALKKMGFFISDEPYVPDEPYIKFDSVPGYTALINKNNSFTTGVIKTSKGNIGTIKIPFFYNQGYWSTSYKAWESYKKEFNGECDEECQRIFNYGLEKLLTKHFVERLEQLKTHNISKLLIDVTANNGGTGWYEEIARLLTDKLKLDKPGASFIKHDHWKKNLEIDLKIVERDLANNKLSKSLKSKLLKMKDLIEGTIRKCESNCLSNDVWDNNKIECLELIKHPYEDGLPFGIMTDSQFMLLESKELVTAARFRPFKRGLYSGPLFIVQDEKSASATEGFCALLQMNKVATIVGRNSQGAGCGYTNGGVKTILKHIGLSVKMPDCARYTGDGKNEVFGIKPDIRLSWGRFTDSSFKKGKILFEGVFK